VVNLGDGDVDWAAVRQALAEINYSGSAIAELEGGDSKTESHFGDISNAWTACPRPGVEVPFCFDNTLAMKKALKDFEDLLLLLVESLLRP